MTRLRSNVEQVPLRSVRSKIGCKGFGPGIRAYIRTVAPVAGYRQVAAIGILPTRQLNMTEKSVRWDNLGPRTVATGARRPASDRIVVGHEYLKNGRVNSFLLVPEELKVVAA